MEVFTVGEWLHVIDAYLISVRTDEPLPKDMHIRAMLADHCDGVLELRYLAEVDGEPAASPKWVRKKLGALVAAGRNGADLHALTMRQLLDAIRGQCSDKSDKVDDSEWPTVTAAAREQGVNTDVITKAANSGALRDNGKKGRERRIHSASLIQWSLSRVER